jgi:hypothetical protein
LQVAGPEAVTAAGFGVGVADCACTCCPAHSAQKLLPGPAPWRSGQVFEGLPSVLGNLEPLQDDPGGGSRAQCWPHGGSPACALLLRVPRREEWVRAAEGTEHHLKASVHFVQSPNCAL